jgi:parallel beta-helix repeat protein
MIPSQFLRRQDFRAGRRRQANRRRLCLESLEGRQLLSTFSVTNTDDSGAGSLRQAILSSNASSVSGVNTISFDIGGGGPQTISLNSALPAITHAVVIDGTTQPGTGTTPSIVLDGSAAGATAVGLRLRASNSTLKGLVIDSFGAGGVLISCAANDTITGDYIGVTAAGDVAAGNGGNGIHFVNGARKNVVSDDVISANGLHGVAIDGRSDDNTVEGCMIGTDSTGTHALGNTDSGVYIENSSNGNTIGGTTAGAANVISGNLLRGVHIGSGSSHNLIEGNFIGTDITGTQPLGNHESGVLISGGSDCNTVGGASAAARDIISSNGVNGVHLAGASLDNVVAGNFIGTDVSGAKPLGNADSGVCVQGRSNGNTIGGAAAGAGNIISANGASGVLLDTGSKGNVIKGDMIGTDVTGTLGLGNARSGVRIADGANDNVVGGTTSTARNVISANRDCGIDIDGALFNLVEGNYIGTDVSGTKALGNGDNGVMIDNASDTNFIGGTAPGAGNVISGNTTNGIHIDSGSRGNLVEGNAIGTTAGGSSALGNGKNGVLITGHSSDNVVGGASPADANTISNNHANGVTLNGAGEGNLVERDTIEYNTDNGVFIDNSSSTTVSNSTSEYNTGWGILVTSSSNVTLINNKTGHNGLGGISR